MQTLPVFTELPQLRQFLLTERKAGKRIGLVPTMGALHSGHLSLVQSATEESDCVVVSLFVNPTQFGPNEDFAQYPRTLEQDMMLLSSVGAHLLFLPTVETMYPRNSATFIEVGPISELWEGEHRPGHFRGVATVVLKLLNIVGPDLAFFGQKDYQQVCVIRQMVDDLNVPVELRVCPTVREPDGLAMSSRNRYLSAQERADSLVLSQSLNHARKRIRNEQVYNREQILAEMRHIIESAENAVLDYIALVDPENLQPLQTLSESQKILALLAVRIGTTRLIDNAIF
ncbi:MAG: pantoate--beta-alanine ligase [Thermoguttaceae bacterium]